METNGLENNTENPELTRKFSELGIRNFRLPSQNREILWILTRNLEKFPGSNPELGKFLSSDLELIIFSWVLTQNSEVFPSDQKLENLVFGI